MVKRDLTPLGREIKKRLLDLGISQKQFCKQMGLVETRLSELMHGVLPGHKYKKIIANALKIKTSA